MKTIKTGRDALRKQYSRSAPQWDFSDEDNEHLLVRGTSEDGAFLYLEEVGCEDGEDLRLAATMHALLPLLLDDADSAEAYRELACKLRDALKLETGAIGEMFDESRAALTAAAELLDGGK